MTGVLFLPRHVFRHRKINRFTASFETRKRNRTIVRVFIKFRVIGCAGPYARAQLAPLSKTGSLLRPPSETPRSSLGKCTLKSRCPGRRFVANGMEGTIRRRRREPTTDGRTTTAAGEFDCERRNGFSYDRVGPPFSRRLFSSLPFFFVSPVYGRRQFSTERYRHVRKSTHCLRHATAPPRGSFPRGVYAGRRELWYNNNRAYCFENYETAGGRGGGVVHYASENADTRCVNTCPGYCFFLLARRGPFFRSNFLLSAPDVII